MCRQAQMETLNKLWALANAETDKAQKDSLAFDSIGLILIRPLKNMGYQSTPTNVSTFAHTGGDGVHFSLLHLEGEIAETSPVVMTVPMRPDRPNIIVGGNLFEFLCLGERTGYFCLEQLAYDQNETINWLRHPEVYLEQAYKSNFPDPYWVELFQRRTYLLNILRSAFGLKAWDKVEHRLDELQKQYMALLEFKTV